MEVEIRLPGRRSEMREYMIGIIKQHWYYREGELEAMTEQQVREIYERLIDWIG